MEVYVIFLQDNAQLEARQLYGVIEGLACSMQQEVKEVASAVIGPRSSMGDFAKVAALQLLIDDHPS